jgi:hypothetical protein
MKYYTHPYLLANYTKMVEFRRALNPVIFKEQDLLYVDRLGILDNDPNIIVLQPLNDFDKTKTYDFNQLVENRVREFINLSKQRNEPLQLMWSGGIDSTSIYCALMTYIENPQDLIIVGNNNSIEEYPKLYDKIIEKHKFINLGIADFAINYNNLFTDTSIIITGEIADQLFMTQIIGKLPENITDWNTDPWQLLLNSNTSEYHSTVEYFVNNYPITITTVKDFLRAIRFNFKYQRVQLRQCLNLNNPILNKNLFHFYDTKEFNYYALGVSTDQIGEETNYTSSTSVKIPLKNLVLDYTKDQEYISSKAKGKSTLNIVTLNKDRQISNTIDENWNKFKINISYDSNNTNYIIEQPGIPKTTGYRGFSSNIGLVDWKIYKFTNTKTLNRANEVIIYNNYILICGFKENQPKTLENFFTFVGDFVKYEILSDSVSIIRFTNNDTILTRKLVDSALTSAYNEEVERELAQRFRMIDYTTFEIVDPQTL